jgi:hypothetical protein
MAAHFEANGTVKLHWRKINQIKKGKGGRNMSKVAKWVPNQLSGNLKKTTENPRIASTNGAQNLDGNVGGNFQGKDGIGNKNASSTKEQKLGEGQRIVEKKFELLANQFENSKVNLHASSFVPSVQTPPTTSSPTTTSSTILPPNPPPSRKTEDDSEYDVVGFVDNERINRSESIPQEVKSKVEEAMKSGNASTSICFPVNNTEGLGKIGAITFETRVTDWGVEASMFFLDKHTVDITREKGMTVRSGLNLTISSKYNNPNLPGIIEKIVKNRINGTLEIGIWNANYGSDLSKTSIPGFSTPPFKSSADSNGEKAITNRLKMLLEMLNMANAATKGLKYVTLISQLCYETENSEGEKVSVEIGIKLESNDLRYVTIEVSANGKTGSYKMKNPGNITINSEINFSEIFSTINTLLGKPK